MSPIGENAFFHPVLLANADHLDDADDMAHPAQLGIQLFRCALSGLRFIPRANLSRL